MSRTHTIPWSAIRGAEWLEGTNSYAVSAQWECEDLARTAVNAANGHRRNGRVAARYTPQGELVVVIISNGKARRLPSHDQFAQMFGEQALAHLLSNHTSAPVAMGVIQLAQ